MKQGWETGKQFLPPIISSIKLYIKYTNIHVLSFFLSICFKLKKMGCYITDSLMYKNAHPHPHPHPHPILKFRHKKANNFISLQTLITSLSFSVSDLKYQMKVLPAELHQSYP